MCFLNTWYHWVCGGQGGGGAVGGAEDLDELRERKTYIDEAEKYSVVATAPTGEKYRLHLITKQFIKKTFIVAGFFLPSFFVEELGNS